MIAVTFCFLYFQKIISKADFNSPNSINAVLSFETFKPFQFRLFIPIIFKALSFLSFIPSKALFMLMSCVIVYLTILAYYYILGEYFNNKLANLLLAPVIIYPMVWNYILLNESFQYYDLCAILIFTVGLYFILTENFKLLITVFIIGILNKETVIYLLFAFLLFNYKNLLTKKILIKTSTLVLIFLSIKGALFFIFRTNPGDVVEWCYSVNIEILSNLHKNRVYAKNLALSFGGLYIFILALFLSKRWKKFNSINSPQKMYMNFALVPYLILGFFIVYFTEVRVYEELIPMVSTLFIIYLSTFDNLSISIAQKSS